MKSKLEKMIEEKIKKYENKMEIIENINSELQNEIDNNQNDINSLEDDKNILDRALALVQDEDDDELGDWVDDDIDDNLTLMDAYCEYYNYGCVWIFNKNNSKLLAYSDILIDNEEDFKNHFIKYISKKLIKWYRYGIKENSNYCSLLVILIDEGV